VKNMGEGSPEKKGLDSEVGRLPLFSFSDWLGLRAGIAIFSSQCNAHKVQVSLPSSHVLEAALDITVNQVCEESPMYVIATAYFAINITVFNFTTMS
jgi:hypothetical protein